MKRIVIGYCVVAAFTLAWQVSVSHLVGSCDFNPATCKHAALMQTRNALIWPIYLSSLGD